MKNCHFHEALSENHFEGEVSGFLCAITKKEKRTPTTAAMISVQKWYEGYRNMGELVIMRTTFSEIPASQGDMSLILLQKRTFSNHSTKEKKGCRLLIFRWVDTENRTITLTLSVYFLLRNVLK